MLIAEDLLLLLTDDATGRLEVSSTELDVALGGALLLELSLLGRVRVAGAGEQVREGRLVVDDPSGTGDAVLDEALVKVVKKAGRKPAEAVRSLGGKVRPALYARLAERGVLKEERGKVFGLFPTTSWPAEDASHEASVRASLESALRNGRAADERTAALVSLLSALNAVPKAVDPSTLGMDKKQVKAAAKGIAEGEWASAAVRSSIDAMNTAIAVAATTAATTAAITSS